MRKLVLFIHTSLDGFTAGPKGEMDWIRVDNEVFRFAGDRTKYSDTALYGRKTFELMDAYWPTAGNNPNASPHDVEHSAWYNNVLKVVISTTLKERNNVRVISKNVAEEISALKNQPGKDILVFGSSTASHTLMAAGLIDEYWLFVNPVLLGSGLPAFAKMDQRTLLRLVDTHLFSSGVVCLHYASN